MATSYLAIGLMSGTSLDGVDAALVRTDGQFYIEPLAACTVQLPPPLQAQLMALASGEAPLNEVLRVEKTFTEFNVAAVQQLLDMPAAQRALAPNVAANVAANVVVDVIGFHGQTLRHLPDEGLTFQMGNSALLAEKTHLPVVADFRRRDMAAGGEGAPLASLYHAAILSENFCDGDHNTRENTRAKNRDESPTNHVVLNLGGVANCTVIKGGDIVTSGDVGPGNGLLDLWMQTYFNQPYDADGRVALQGTIDDEWVEATLLATPFFQKSLPKSADRHQFSSCWPAHLSPTDGAATLAALTAQAAGQHITEALGQCLSPAQQADVKLWLTGGGVRNMAIRSQLEKKFPHVRPIDDIGMSSDMLEAACFAWLAVRRLIGLPTSSPQTTGAAIETIGGVLTV